MDSSVSLEDRIWFLRVCHHVPFSLYLTLYSLSTVCEYLTLYNLSTLCQYLTLHTLSVPHSPSVDCHQTAVNPAAVTPAIKPQLHYKI